jgi:predicted phage tail protein
MKKLLFVMFISILFIACSGDNKEAATVTTDAATPAVAEEAKPAAATELLDLSTSEPVKNAMIAFSRGDIDGMTALYDDNVRYTWSSGDSLIGKQAVKDYYVNRWKLIDSLNYTDFIFLPIKANQSQTPNVQTGKWILGWAFAHVKYKNGKKLHFWLHQVNHFNDAGKIDFVGQYLDRAPINEATRSLMKK